MKAHPKLLYKYRDWSNEYHRRPITQSELWFASVTSFNDPFDCNIPIRWDLASPEYLKTLIIKHLKEDYPKTSLQELNNLADKKIKSGKYRDPEYLIRVDNEKRKDIERNFGICCLSKNRNSLLMWSHYANCHKGYCFGVDFNGLLEFFEELAKQNILIDDFPVIYDNDFPELIPEFQNDSQFVLDQFRYKAKNWEHEKEHRLVYWGATNKPLILPKGLVNEIVLGCMIPTAHKNEILSILNRVGFSGKIFQAFRENEKFKLHFERISLL